MAQDPAETSLKGLVTAAVADLQRLVKAQIALAKLELQQTGQDIAKTSILAIVALTMAGVGGLFLLVTIAYVLVALGLPVWAGFGIVTLVLFIVAAIVGLLARREAKRISPPVRTSAEIEKTKEAITAALAPPVTTEVVEVEVIAVEQTRPSSTG